MAFKTVASLDCDKAISLGGMNKKENKKNPTSIEGYYLGFKEVESPMSKTGKAKLHIFQTPSGNTGVWGKTKLDSALMQVTPGAMVRATYTGQGKPSKGRQGAYLFTVEVDDENTIEVSSGNSSSYSDSGNSYADETEDYGNESDDYDNQDDYVADAPVAKSAVSGDSRAKVQALLAKGRAATNPKN